jgi:hypothetical protein
LTGSVEAADLDRSESMAVGLSNPLGEHGATAPARTAPLVCLGHSVFYPCPPVL